MVYLITLSPLVLVVALAAVSVTTVAKLSSVNSRNIAMMQEQCREFCPLWLPRTSWLSG